MIEKKLKGLYEPQKHEVQGRAKMEVYKLKDRLNLTDSEIKRMSHSKLFVNGLFGG